ncbi:MAG TPA: hypothetical protein K8U79_03555 [Clostridium perfringens]|nr:hypothetical protein [Clostridium perfringens]
MIELKYEHFVRNAFGEVDRGGDLAGLAEADIFRMSYNDKQYLNKVKAALAYSISIYNNKFSNYKRLNDPVDYVKMEEFLEQALSIKDTQEAINLIDRYNQFKSYAEALPENI